MCQLTVIAIDCGCLKYHQLCHFHNGTNQQRCLANCMHGMNENDTDSDSERGKLKQKGELKPKTIDWKTILMASHDINILHQLKLERVIFFKISWRALKVARPIVYMWILSLTKNKEKPFTGLLGSTTFRQLIQTTYNSM